MPRYRAGVTLLEVVIAMLVVAVGLLGLAALLPVGSYELAEAVKYDRGSTLGRAAFRDLLVRGCLRPDMWLYVGNSSAQPVPVVRGATFQASPTAGPASKPPFMPIVIDPLMVAVNANSGSMVSVFPYRIGASSLEAGAPLISRVTLRQFPQPIPPQMLSLSAAERIFRSADDLVFTMPTDKALDPMPVFQAAPGLQSTRANVAARSAQGDYSWLVTVSPSIAESQGYPGLPGNALTVRQFSVCVVVLYKRPMEDVSDPAMLKNQNRGERLVWVDFLGMGSNTSSDARLRMTNVNNQQAAEQALAVKADQWIMVTGRLMGQNPIMASTSPAATGPASMTPIASYPITVVQWYRVISAADSVTAADSTGSAWYRSVKLSGRDYNTFIMGSTGNVIGPMFVDEDSFKYQSGSDPTYDPPSGYGTILGGAIGVYEKSLTTDGTSMWTYQ